MWLFEIIFTDRYSFRVMSDSESKIDYTMTEIDLNTEPIE